MGFDPEDGSDAYQGQEKNGFWYRDCCHVNGIVPGKGAGRVDFIGEKDLVVIPFWISPTDIVVNKHGKSGKGLVPQIRLDAKHYDGTEKGHAEHIVRIGPAVVEMGPDE